ncbi:hypothetical protein, partial [Pseudomonas sp. BMS12]|uniref:hypothetical protein n=1 Tax=Pseudomonas sp. BMS12 TaxID=1796033 RepID=UPI001F22DBE1
MESAQVIFKNVQQRSSQLSSWLQPSRRLQGHCGKANTGFAAAVFGSAPSLTIVSSRSLRSLGRPQATLAAAP